MNALRLLGGLLIAPGAPALVLYWINLGHASPGDAPLLSILLAIVAYCAAIVIGMPVHLALRARGRSGLPAYLASGACTGLLAYLAVLPPGAWLVEGGLATLGYALMASWLFWLIAIRPARPLR